MSDHFAATAPTRLSADSTARIKDVLVARIRQERAERKTVGPWDLLIDENCTWCGQTLLDRSLFFALRKCFGGNVTREILLAAAGVKVSRTCVSDAQLGYLLDLENRYGFAVRASSERYVHRRDIGKGGSSNTVERVADADHPAALRNVYVAVSEDLVEAAQMLEEAGDDEIFGTLLGIPRCCREAFMKGSSQAAAKQNDFVLLTLDNTQGPIPYDYWLNYPANYFGSALLSFFPCSFRCIEASKIARHTYQMLAGCDQVWANEILERHRTNILYTEYEGLHLFRAPVTDNWIRYEPKQYVCTEPTAVSALIRSGNRMYIGGMHQVDIYRDGARIHSIERADIGMCVFH
jgi:hypothetical protein